jgi:cytochrome c5
VVEKRDQQFFDAFMLLVGIFVGIIVGVILLGDLVGDGESAEAGGAHSMIEERIQPLGQVAVTGDPAPAPAPVAVAQVPAISAAPAAAAPAGAAAPAAMAGSAVYEQACALCHVPPGLAGAPAFGDAASWAPRIAQGPALLAEHVINGYQGSTGVMPPKGGRVDLSDDDVLAAMQYMLDAVGP